MSVPASVLVFVIVTTVFSAYILSYSYDMTMENMITHYLFSYFVCFAMFLVKFAYYLPYLIYNFLYAFVLNGW